MTVWVLWEIQKYDVDTFLSIHRTFASADKERRKRHDVPYEVDMYYSIEEVWLND